MRISDWSSDVCSSDLAFNRMTEQLEGQTGVLVNVNEQLEARRSFIEAVLSGVSSAVVSVDAGRRILLANAAAERLIGQSAESLTGQPLDDVAPELARLLTGRSEEHTSELPSLMRISYAVFCLKNT